MWSTGEATDHDMLTPEMLPHSPQASWQGRFKPCLGPDYFLLQLSDCMMETCVLLAVVRAH